MLKELTMGKHIMSIWMTPLYISTSVKVLFARKRWSKSPCSMFFACFHNILRQKGSKLLWKKNGVFPNSGWHKNGKYSLHLKVCFYQLPMVLYKPFYVDQHVWISLNWVHFCLIFLHFCIKILQKCEKFLPAFGVHST